MLKREVLLALPFSRETTTTITVLHEAIVAVLFEAGEFDSESKNQNLRFVDSQPLRQMLNLSTALSEERITQSVRPPRPSSLEAQFVA